MKFTVATLAALATGASAFAPVPTSSTTSNGKSSLMMANRQPIMAGNWKMNPATEEDALGLAGALTKLLGEETCPMDEENESCTEVVIFPPHPFISKVKDVAEEVGISVGAQSIFFEDKGAYTGSVAASMVKSIGCEYILCGHSERRAVFNDDDQAINRKVRKVLDSNMKAILCIGETKEEYDLEIKNEICKMQLSKDLLGVEKEQMKVCKNLVGSVFSLFSSYFEIYTAVAKTYWQKKKT
jgi:triosephosphate isomerase